MEVLMPIYEYHCDKCNTTIERIQKFSDPIQTVCEVCGGPVKKLMGKPALQFKGTGFYITDYARKGMTDAGSSESSSSSEGSEKKTATESSPTPSAPSSTAPSSGSDTKTA
jgi:putative FmdB family regulatory protein